MKKFKALFVVAIATIFMVGNAVADNISLDLSNGSSIAEEFKNYTFDLNHKNNTPKKFSKILKNYKEKLAI